MISAPLKIHWKLWSNEKWFVSVCAHISQSLNALPQQDLSSSSPLLRHISNFPQSPFTFDFCHVSPLVSLAYSSLWLGGLRSHSPLVVSVEGGLGEFTPHGSHVSHFHMFVCLSMCGRLLW